MLILILIDVQYSQNAVFSYEKGSNRQNHSSSPPGKKIRSSKISDPHPPLNKRNARSLRHSNVLMSLLLTVNIIHTVF